MISCDEVLALKKNRILIDIRDFESFLSCHIKSSYHMEGLRIIESEEDDPEVHKMSELYSDFLALYHENYPDNLIVLIGDQENYGHIFVRKLLHSYQTTGPLARICLLRGGIDAVKLEFP